MVIPILQLGITSSLAMLTLIHGALKSLRMICAMCSAKIPGMGKCPSLNTAWMCYAMCAIRVVDVVAETGAAVGQGDVDQAAIAPCLRHASFKGVTRISFRLRISSACLLHAHVLQNCVQNLLDLITGHPFHIK